MISRRTALLALVAPLVACNNSASSAKGLNPRIGKPNREKYFFIQDGAAWRNPKLLICAEGIEIRAQSLSTAGLTVPVTDLGRTLIALPVSAWPYGRVVAAADNGVRALDRDDEPIKRNHDEAERILRSLGVTVDWWPSA
jgi:hypothetical protein